MDIVADLVTGPYREIIEKGNTAIENAGDNQEMLSASQRVVKGAERCLKIIEPLCARHLKESEVAFTNALKDNNDIAEFRLQLTDTLWDFDEYTEPDTFDKDKYTELWELCKKSGVKIGEILKRLKLEAPAAPVAATPSAVTTESQTPVVLIDSGIVHPPSEAEPKVEELEPPPPPPTNPWDLRTTPTIETGATLTETIERRPPVSTMSSPVSEPNSPEYERRSSRLLETGVDRLLTDEERYHMSPQDMRPPPLSPPGRTSTLSAPIPGDHAIQPRPHRYSQASSVHSHPSRQRSLESMHGSVFDGWKEEGTRSPAMTDHRSSTASGQDGQLSPLSRGAVIPPNFPPGIHEGIERVPLVTNDYEAPIPVDSESTHSRPASMMSARPKDCSIGLSSSFYLYKGFCDGAKEVIRGGAGIKKVKKPGFSGAHVVAQCESCYYETDFNQMQADVNYAEEANYQLNKIGYRVRFLQKSHIATKRADEALYGCVFCVQSQRTLEECDATVFFSQKKLFEHLARHPRPLPQVPGVTVVEEAEIPFNLRNNYDLHFRAPPKPSPLADKQLELSQLPHATATQTVKRMYGMRLLYDQTPAFELANGARLSGVAFPAKYNGEWIMAWHEGNYGSAPVDVVKLEPPPRAEIKMDTTSNIFAVARWKFAPKSKDGGDWLKFDQGERITNISWAWQDHWCWSGTNAKGTWGIFPQTHIDTNTIRETTDRSSISSSERKRSEGFFGRLTSRKSSQRPSSVAEVMVSSGPRPSVF
ncbi:hypothetical protein CGCSCA4_v012167 [Colletotrichum siamense]|uniref:SH3 domain-containing protein n=1 Tax=Colletotrichum siamense TaxID=690259 RepID=A0A9P5BT83_COLSI|nr:hypothetical protein CGCSCA4_v012167 [Colletotrichum siamense]KAF4850845.1 hypothetical protein CGCSCA2_v011258 [Colletotrichum siamense]